jgi:hypothetical protein
MPAEGYVSSSTSLMPIADRTLLLPAHDQRIEHGAAILHHKVAFEADLSDRDVQHGNGGPLVILTV